MPRKLMAAIYKGKLYRFPEDQEAYEKAKFGESDKRTTLAYSLKRPGESLAMSVHRDECDHMNREIKRHGVQGVHYDKTKKKNCVITSRGGRRDLMKKMGHLVGMQNVHDADGGYGDG